MQRIGGAGVSDADGAVAQGRELPAAAVVETDLAGVEAADETILGDPETAIVVIRPQTAVDQQVDRLTAAARDLQLRLRARRADADVAGILHHEPPAGNVRGIDAEGAVPAEAEIGRRV